MSTSILLIEDDDLAAELIRFIVTRLGHTLIWAADGDSGRRHIKESKPDIIMLDLMLPFIDGFDLLSEIRAQPETAKTPVLVLTGKTREEDIQRVLAAGASDYLAKPFQPAELSNRLGRLIKRLG